MTTFAAGRGGMIRAKAAAISPAPSIVSVDALAGGHGGATSYTRSFTVANNSNRKLLVCFAEDRPEIVFSNVQWGGVALTLIHSATATNTRAEIWELNNPTAGTANITWNTADTNFHCMFALDIRDASQAVIGAGDKTTATSALAASGSTALTSVANSLLLDVICGAVSGTALNEVGDGTQIANVTATGQNRGGVSATTATGIGTVTHTWNWTPDQQFAQAMIMIRPV